jgi:hypothetical protein
MQFNNMRFLNLCSILYCLLTIFSQVYHFFNFRISLDFINIKKEFYNNQMTLSIFCAIIFTIILILSIYALAKKIKSLQIYLAAFTIFFALVFNLVENFYSSVAISDQIIDGEMIESSH